MEIIVKGRNAEVSDRFRKHVGDKLRKIEQFAPRAQRVDVEVTHEPNPSQAETSERIEITVVDNDDPTGVVAPPEPQEDSGSETVGATASEGAPAESQEDSGSADGASPQDADSAAVVGAEPEADYDGAVGDGAEALSGAVGAGADSAESAPEQDPAAPDRDSEEPAEEAGWPPADSDSTTGAPAGPDADAGAAADPEDVAAAADSLPDPADQIPEFLPGEEELEALLAETSGMDEDGR